MSENNSESELLLDFLYYFLNNECSLGKVTSTKIAAQFSDLTNFVNFNFKRFKIMKSANGTKLIRGFNNTHISNIQEKLSLIDLNLPLKENYIQAIGRQFILQVISNIEDLTLEKLNPNPFLISVLNLNTVKEMIEFIVFQRVTRSIVTSFGTCVETLIVASGSQKLKKGFDILKIIDNISHYIQVKSGTSDMDKDQIKYWKKEIENIEDQGHFGYIGMTYGKRDENAVSLNLMKNYLPNWEARTLIGKDLWDFISGEDDYHKKVIKSLKNAATHILNVNSIVDKIETISERIVKEFNDKYGENVEDYINSLF